MKSPSSKPTAPDRDIFADYREAYRYLEAKGPLRHVVKAGHQAFNILTAHKIDAPEWFRGVELAFSPSKPANHFGFHRKHR